MSTPDNTSNTPSSGGRGRELESVPPATEPTTASSSSSNSDSTPRSHNNNTNKYGRGRGYGGRGGGGKGSSSFQGHASNSSNGITGAPNGQSPPTQHPYSSFQQQNAYHQQFSQQNRYYVPQQTYYSQYPPNQLYQQAYYYQPNTAYPPYYYYPPQQPYQYVYVPYRNPTESSYTQPQQNQAQHQDSPKQTAWKVKGSPTPSPTSTPRSKNSKTTIESAFAGLSLQSDNVPLSQKYELLKLPLIPPNFRSLLVGRVLKVELVDYSKEFGMVVKFVAINNNIGTPPSSPMADQGPTDPPNFEQLSSSETNNHSEEQTFLGLLSWGVFPKEIKDLDPETRLELSERRVPRGSTFSVYVNSIETNGELFLTLARKPAPILKHSTLQDSNIPSVTEGGKKSKYRYLIIVDLEATCDFSPKPEIDHKNSEIIEFPWVVLDTETLQIVHEKQIYLRPSNMAGITPYCRVLTGITEETVSSGCSLGDAISNFNDYVTRELPVDSFRILTDGVWDLQVQLRQECIRKGIPLEKWFWEYFDLKEEFRMFLPWFPFSAREPPLYIMLQALGLDFVGRHHAGLDDCHSIGKVVASMIRLGHIFDKTTVIPPTYDHTDDPSYIGFPSLAPSDSWKCIVCTDKYKDPEGSKYYEGPEDSNFRAVWNKPLASTCRFCKSTRPYSPEESIKCQICGTQFTLTEKEIQYYQNKKWYYPRHCINCRFSKTQVYS